MTASWPKITQQKKRHRTLSDVMKGQIMFNANETLVDILGYRRQHDSAGEAAFIEKYITPLYPVRLGDPVRGVAAYVLHIPGNDKLMWSCHIDTVHWDNPEVIRQDIWVDNEGLAFVDSSANCLGADDGAGVWLMLEMYKAGVPGMYVFHRGEERGCWGSGWLAENEQDWLKGFTHAIAFDRRGTTSIITHQRSGRACSDALGNTLIHLLDMGHKLDPTGVYTDTAEYMDIIPECVNISIGYQNEHSDLETCDLVYVQALRDKICSIDWRGVTLPVDRDPNERAFNQWWHVGGTSAQYDGYAERLDPTEIPTYRQLAFSSVDQIEEWVAQADPRDVAYAIMDMLDVVESLQGEMYV